jgi:hypothetical protein
MRACIGFLAGGVYLAVALSCGAAQVTAYQTADELCEALEQKVEEREGSTLAEDERDLRTIRRACDEVFDRIEESGD